MSIFQKSGRKISINGEVSHSEQKVFLPVIYIWGGLYYEGMGLLGVRLDL